MASNTSNSINWTEPIFPPIDSPPPVIVYPNDSYTISQGYAAYGCFIAILLLVLFAVVIKIALKRKQLQHRNAALRRNIARQNQLATVSRSIDANSIYSNDGESNRRRRDSDATLKIDLPPTYEDAMKNFTESREVVATSPTISTEEPVETIDTHGTVAIEIVTIPNSQQRSIVV
ncbi:uncharacterized protein LOC129905366 isoform X1 [Episyrphus balteatus]|uniref:uncharacterized protein LOC129905366 isoform X1 n=1 Tax=Episyrphus balteatus TaxID=286459 RepID=UPI002485FD72|nr:uncharacterized protein LOC129905366 isoform X1 [Episyrphus balteatus]